MAWGHRGPTTKTLGVHLPTTTWDLQTARDLEDQTRAQGFTGGTTSRGDGGHKTLMEARTSTVGMRAGDRDQVLDRGTREVEAEATEEEGGMVETGVLMTGSTVTEESSEDGEMTGSEAVAPAGPEVEVTLTSLEARKRAMMSPKTWVEAGTTEAEGDRHEEGVHQEQEVTTVTGTGSRCMMGHHRRDASVHLLCRAWTWPLCPPASAPGRTAQELETLETGILLEPMEPVLPGMTAVSVHQDAVDGGVGVLEVDPEPGEEDHHSEEHLGGVAGAGSARFGAEADYGHMTPTDNLSGEQTCFNVP